MMDIDKQMEPSSSSRRTGSMLATTGFGPEREKFEKDQTECITKAIKPEECPAKEKHVRRTIIGTWQERGSATFWNILGKMPLPTQNIMCWKSLMVFHKILREGHPNSLKDSYIYKRTLQDLFSVYKFTTSLYGHLISHYLKVLMCKLTFHHRYQKIPGSLVFSEDNPMKLPHRDINDVFHFAVEVFDYQDLLLSLEEAVFKTLDKSRNNSQVHASQCRIAPLVPLVKECSGLYDIINFIMIKLHRNLPPDALEGHRGRFNDQFNRLKTFFFEAGALTYVTSLTTVPHLSDSPPSFLIHSREQPKPKEPEEKPTKSILPQKDDRDFLIEQLMREINDLRETLELTERRARETEDRLRMQIMRLQEDFEQYKRIAEQACDENVFLKSQLEEFTKETKETKESEESKEKEKKVIEMFNKLKERYTELRNEHVQLIRAHAEAKRKVESSEKTDEEGVKRIKDAEDLVTKKQDELDAAQETILQLEKSHLNNRETLEQIEKEKNIAVAELMQRLNSMNDDYDKSQKTKEELEAEVERLKAAMDSQMETSQKQMERITTNKVTEEIARKNAEDIVTKLKEDDEKTKAEHEKRLLQVNTLIETIKESRQNSEHELVKLQTEMQNKMTELTTKLESVSKERDQETQAKKAAETTVESLKESSGNEVQHLTTSLQETSFAKGQLELEKQVLMKEMIGMRDKLEKENQDMNLQVVELTQNMSMEQTLKEVITKELASLKKEHVEKVEGLTTELCAVSKVKEEQETSKQEIQVQLAKERESYVLQNQQKEEDQAKNDADTKYSLIVSTVEECQNIIKETIEQFDNPLHTSGTTCTAEYLKSRLEPITPSVDTTTKTYLDFRLQHQDSVIPVLSSLTSLTHSLSDGLLHGKATSHMGSLKDAEVLVCSCKEAANTALEYLSTLKQRDPESGTVESNSERLKQKISRIINFATELIPKESDTIAGIDDIVDQEINATAQLVADAAARIEEMLNKSRKQHTGVQLEVNERILETCNDLMKAIRQLIVKSKDLQEEIVSEGMGTASAKEFYKRHNKWTEGLISAAKSVGWGASVLVNAADKVVEGTGKFEELLVASSGITASTAQLVAASRVKASRSSEKLGCLMSASKGVGAATAGVVASVKTGSQMTEEAKTVPDYTKLSLTQAKRYEMDCQVKILELESDLVKHRSKLGKLRAAHYQIAAELGLIDEDEDGNGPSISRFT